MTVYLSILICGILLYAIMRKIKNGQDMYFTVMLAVLLAISSMRAYFIGADYRNYVYIFEGVQRIGFRYPYEKGYVLLNMIVDCFTDSYIGVGLAVNIIIFSCFYFYVQKFVETRYKVWVLYIFFMNPYLYIQSTFNVLRQGCAMGIIAMGIYFLYKKNWVKYILIVLLAAQFHKVGYVFLLLIAFRLLCWDKRKFLILIITTVLLNMILRNTTFMGKLFSLFGFGGYTNYENSMFDFSIYAIFILCFVLFLLAYYDRIYYDELSKFFLDLYLLSLCVLPLAVKNDMVYRVYVMMAFLALPAIPIILKSFKQMERRANYYIISTGYIIYYALVFMAFFYRMNATGNTHYVPFRFFWDTTINLL